MGEDSWCGTCGTVVFCVSIGFIIAGTAQWKSLRDIDDWETTQCQPKYWSRGGKCCRSENSDQQCTKHGKSADYWREVFDDRCDGTILKQHDAPCMDDNFYTAWPNGSYTEEFLLTNQTETCWTDCIRYMMEDPSDKHEKAQTQLWIGYGILLAGICATCCLGCISREEEPISVCVAFMYFVHWISISNCTFHISKECKVLTAGYYLNWLAPFTLLALGCLEQTCPGIDCDKFFMWFTPLVLVISIVLLIIATANPPDGDLKACFDVTFCEQQLYTTLGVYGVIFGGPLLLCIVYTTVEYTRNYRDDWSKKRSQNKETNLRLNMLHDIERKWQGQKDIIFPLIDYREHIWNEIWTICWEMEECFFDIPLDDPEMQKEIYCSDLRQGIQKYKCSVKDFNFGVYGRKKCCAYKNRYTLKMIAETKGQIDWKVARSRPNLISHYSSSFLQFVAAPHQKAYERQMSREVQELEDYYPQSEIQNTFDAGYPSAPPAYSVASQQWNDPPAYSSVLPPAYHQSV